MKRKSFIGFLLLLISCSKEASPPSIELNYTFESGAQGWQGFFSDYPGGEEVFYELEFAVESLPSPLDNSVKALKISGNNHSDDLFSAIYRKFDNLMPLHTYAVTFDVDLASNAQIEGVGIGGSPDLSLGVGGLSYAPANITTNPYRPNFESRLQSGLSNNVFSVVGTIGVSTEFPTPFTLINRNNLTNPFILQTNNKGELWLMVATDSGFEGITTLYYKSIKIVLKP